MDSKLINLNPYLSLLCVVAEHIDGKENLLLHPETIENLGHDLNLF